MICQTVRWMKPNVSTPPRDSFDPHSIEGTVYDFYHALILLNWIHMNTTIVHKSYISERIMTRSIKFGLTKDLGSI